VLEELLGAGREPLLLVKPAVGEAGEAWIHTLRALARAMAQTSPEADGSARWRSRSAATSTGHASSPTVVPGPGAGMVTSSDNGRRPTQLMVRAVIGRIPAAWPRSSELPTPSSRGLSPPGSCEPYLGG